MNSTPSTFFYLFICLFIIGIGDGTAQTVETTHVLQEKGKAPIEGTIISMNETEVVFADYGEFQRTILRTEIVSLNFEKKQTPYLSKSFRTRGICTVQEACKRWPKNNHCRRCPRRPV